MRRGRSRAAILVVLAFAWLAGCSASSTAGQTPSGQTTSTSNRFGAPTVEHPVDVAAVVGKPCELLTPEDLKQLGLPLEGRQRMIVDIPSCRWSSRDLQDLSLAVDGDRDLLAETYRVPWNGVFIPTFVAGYPSVVQKTGRGQYNSCTVTTGLGPRQAVTADWTAPGEPRPGNDACEFAEQATALVIRKLPPQR